MRILLGECHLENLPLPAAQCGSSRFSLAQVLDKHFILWSTDVGQPFSIRADRHGVYMVDQFAPQVNLRVATSQIWSWLFCVAVSTVSQWPNGCRWG